MFKILLLPLLMNSSYASDLAGKSFRFEYENDAHYEVKFTDKSVTWKGVKGYDQGRSETDAYLIEKVTPMIYFIQWTENDKTLVTLTLDTKSNRVFSSGVSGGSSWFQKGKVLPLTR